MKLTNLVIILGIVVSFTAFASGADERDPAGMTDDGSGIPANDANGKVVGYTTLDNARMKAETGAAVLFFNAAWCPTCRAALADLTSRQGELGDITVFLVDYDSEKDLKRRYAVSAQHTFVQIDTNGDAVLLWNGGATDMLLHKIEGLDAG